MIEPRQPKFQWGQRVRTLADLINDGSFPDAAPDLLLAPAGAIGEIVQVGMHVEANLPVYLVEFPDRRVIGCREEEIAAL
ncbi:nitrogen fixation protein NifZ [Niveispirillum irakense]|uniref:nitrogen fixation protein NifZ n=1 Tax=Niveispirillum irakense TaxID=34011 RepID=UPI00041BE2BF|nr:nitrogen fixation protein NifZ [Niveispirillum irakense]